MKFIQNTLQSTIPPAAPSRSPPSRAMQSWRLRFLRITKTAILFMELDDVQRASQEQFARRSHRYGKGHILENVDDVREAVKLMSLPQRAEVLDMATGGGHTGLFLASLGHKV